MKIGSISTTFVLLLIVLHANTVSPTNLSLYWGFTVDDTFWFTMNYTGEFDDMVDCAVYLQAKHLNSIPLYNNLLPLLFLEPSDTGVYNRSIGETFTEMVMANYRIELSYHHVEFGGISRPQASVFTPLAIPLGNLSLLSDLVLEWYGQNLITVLESEDYWGFEVTYNVFQNISSVYMNWNVTMQAHLDYCKDDGFLAHYHGLTTYVDTGDIFQEVSLDRNGLDWQTMTPFSYVPPESLFYTQLVQTMYLTAGLAWAIVIIFIFFDYKKRVSLIK